MTDTTYPGLPMSLCPGLTAQGHGTVVVTRQYPSQDEHCEAVGVTVDQADPRIVVTHDLLERIRVGDDECPMVGARLVLTSHDRTVRCRSSDAYCYTGSWLHIDAANQHLVYQIGAYRPDGDMWEAAWPD